MSPSSKKFKKQSSSKAVKPPLEDNDPSLPSFSSLPDEIVLDCLQRVPRSYYLNLCRVSKTLSENNAPHTIYRWFTLKKTTMKTAMKTFGYKLVKIPVPFPSHHHMYNSSAVAVGSEIYFVGGSFKPLSDLWILDTRTGMFTQGPSMRVARTDEASVGVINGKIYVIGGCEDKRQAEVFDPKFTPWKLGESVCMIREKGLMGFDVNRKVWVKVVGLKTLNVKFDVTVMAEYDGKLAILWCEIDDTKTKKEIWCSVIALDWIGEGIRGTIEWSGIVATKPDYYEFHNCLVVSD
ncbi:unnamed protein product [Arabidopsis lyrata]|nr:unnamed protein product [Arabidopsis lyrata]